VALDEQNSKKTIPVQGYTDLIRPLIEQEDYFYDPIEKRRVWNKSPSSSLLESNLCPNYLLSHSTYTKDLKENAAIVFGTGNALTQSVNPWHLLKRLASQMGESLSSNQTNLLFSALTCNAAESLGLFHKGRIQEHCDADLVLLKVPTGCKNLTGEFTPFS
jgi:hypothetical protein